MQRPGTSLEGSGQPITFLNAKYAIKKLLSKEGLKNIRLVEPMPIDEVSNYKFLTFK